MTRKYALPPLENRAEYIKSNFNQIARNYDRFNDLITFGLHRLWKKQVIRRAELPANFRALDLCSGTGDLALLLLDRANPASSVLALDFSPGMLEVLKERAARHPNGNRLETKQADAARLDFLKDNSFNAITIGFGLRNVQERKKALLEAHRILRPGGRLVILDVGHVRPRWLAPFHALYFKRLVPLIGHWLEGRRNEMYDYLPASAEEYPDQIAIKNELLSAGFFEVTITNFMMGSAAMHVAKKKLPLA